MKPLILILLIFVGFNLQANTPKELKESKELGLVSYLTAVKSIAESKMYLLSNSEKFCENKKQKRAADLAYLETRLHVDQLINQMSVDMYQKTSLRLYKKLNKKMKDSLFEMPTKFQVYSTLLTKIENSLNTLNDFKVDSIVTTEAFIDNPLELIEKGFAAYKDFKEARKGKIDSILGIVKELRLSPIKDFSPKEEEKED